SPVSRLPSPVSRLPSPISRLPMLGILARSAAGILYASIALAQSADSIVRQATNVFETGNTPAAVALVRPLADTSATAATLLGRMAWQSANYKEAARWLDAAIALDPRHVMAYIWRGRTYVQIGRAHV